MKWIAIAALLATAALVSSRPAPPELPGPLASGGVLLNNGWRLRPAGKQVPLGTFPMSAALSRDGKYLLVLNGGYEPPSISVLDTATAAEIGRTAVPDGWLGLTLSPKGDRLYVGGGSQAAVFEFSFANGKLAPARTFPVADPAKRTPRDFIGDVAFDPAGRLLYAADLFHDSIAVINPQSGTVIERFETGRRPYRILFHPDGQSLFVSSWADGTVYHHQAEKGTLLQKVRLGAHPTDMVWLPGVPPTDQKPEWTARLFVAAANTNNVYVVGVSESKALRQIETINVALTAWQPAGMTPSALALSPDAKRLYVACSNANAVAVADVSGLRSLPLAFLPTGWYPTAVRVLPDHRIVVLNGRGLRSYPNPKDGPGPSRLQTGTASFIDPPDADALDAYSRAVLENSPYNDELLSDAGTGPGSPVPARLGDPTPIRHVIYIVKETGAYDQVLGDLKTGNGDSSLATLGERITPNHHKLAREFVLLDNFYVNGDTAADGQHWSIAAIASDYVEKLWPNSQGGRRKTSDYEGQEPAAIPASGYLWTQAASAGISMRNYGWFVENRALATVKDGIHVATVRDPVLGRCTNPRFRGVDLQYPDVERAKVFLADLAEYEKYGQFPQLIFMRLGSGNTSGAAAANDAALGMVVEGVSKSRYWNETAIFVVEAGAGNGPDHVDSHRCPAFLISPYVRRGAVDSTRYDTTSMLRTLELILGLRPMTVFDAGARPMSPAFQARPDSAPYQAEPAQVSPVR